MRQFCTSDKTLQATNKQMEAAGIKVRRLKGKRILLEQIRESLLVLKPINLLLSLSEVQRTQTTANPESPGFFSEY